jgi:hypothetical protein
MTSRTIRHPQEKHSMRDIRGDDSARRATSTTGQTAEAGHPSRRHAAGTPTVQVRVYRRGRLLLSELCDSWVDAVDAVDRWVERQGVHCEVASFAVEPRAPGLADRTPPPSPTCRDPPDHTGVTTSRSRRQRPVA